MRSITSLIAGVAVLACGTAGAVGDPAAVPPRGRLWVVPGTEWAAIVVASVDEPYRGQLYLWHREERFGKYHGYYKHIPSQGPVSAWDISWSRDGKGVLFYEEPAGERSLCYLRPEESSIRRLSQEGNVTGSTAWSPNSRYVAFMERTKDGDCVRCFPQDMAMRPQLPGERGVEVFDLPAPQGRAIGAVHWAPDSSALLATAYVAQPGEQGRHGRVSAPALFLTSPGVGSPTIIWQDEKMEGFTPRARWAVGGELVVFSLAGWGGCGGPGPLYAVAPDGSGLRALWEKPEVMRFELSPDGTRALVWLLHDYPGGDHPEPNRMAGVNVLTGAATLFETDMVALEPDSISDGIAQTLEWAEDGSAVSLFARTSPNQPGAQRVTLELP